MKKIAYFLLVLLVSGCSLINKEQEVIAVSDAEASAETRNLFKNLMQVSNKYVLYGHQDDLAYGIGWKDVPGNSDIKAVTGSFPAVFGWDIGGIGDSCNLDSVDFKKMKQWITDAYLMGGINTVSWHMLNPVTKTNAWDTTKAVASILQGGSNHEYFKSKLKQVATFFNSLVGKNGEPIPLIFRPWHEHTGSWFWWGKNHCTKQEYIGLWQFTVHYLRDSLQVHNLLYAYSPDAYGEYMYAYPGDAYVDIMGVDMYFFGNDTTLFATDLADKLHNLVLIGEKHKKIAALTETGREKLIPSNWHTQVLLKAINTNRAGEIAYILTWRNARLEHFYAPFPGHESVSDFLKFKNDNRILFLDKLPAMYK